MLRRREDMERQLGVIAKNRSLFGRPKVFIKADEVPET
jgi:hypothetical protein